MAFCPSCRHEFEDFVQACPDCDAPLVEKLDEPVAPSVPVSAVLGTLLVRDEETFALAEEALLGGGIPFRVVELAEEAGDGQRNVFCALVLPQPMLRSVVGMLDGDPRLVSEAIPLPAGLAEQGASDDGMVLCYRQFEAAEDEDAEIRSPELLERPVLELVARGEEIVADLLEFVRRGDGPTREGALRVLRPLGGAATAALIRLMPVLARQGREGALFRVLKEVKDQVPSDEALAPTVEVAADSTLSPERRRLALHALGQCERTGVYAGILPLLNDPDPEVREDADEALCVLGDADLGFDADLGDAERTALIERWRAHFQRIR